VTAAILTPFTGADARPSGTRWRKKLLPIGEISYKGRTLKFDRPYLTGLVDAFRSRAYDQVPFQLADAANTHTNDPERTAGQITGMTLDTDGLYIEVQPSARGQEVLTTNPGLGVSARIVEGYDRSDGKFFPRAIQHVLGTLDPRIPGMGGWSAVEAANDAQVTYDLSGEAFTNEEGGMPEMTDDQQAKLAELLQLDAGKLAELVASMGSAAPDPEALNGGGDGNGSADPDEAEIQAIADRIDAMTDEELAEWERELEAEEAAAAGAAPEAVPAGAGLSTEEAMAVELAQSTGEENARQLGIISAQLDHERWLNERRTLTSKGGVPPFIADLAQPLLEGTGHVVDLAGGGTVDAGQVVRKILTETGKLLTQMGLQTDVELGSPADEPTEAADAERDDILKRAKQQMGI